MKKINISELLGIWFHDVKVERIQVDYVNRKVELDCVIPVGFWNSPNRDDLTEGEKKGTLILSGLLYIVIEPPDETYCYEDSIGIEITSEGSVTQERFASQLLKMPQDLPDDAFLHYFYVCEWNSFIFVAATGVSFQTKLL